MNEQLTHYLIANRWKTPDGTVLWSKHRHDYVGYIDTLTNEYFAVDGGNDYCKVVGDWNSLTNLCIYNTDKHEVIREVFSWGSYGKNQDEELHFILLKDLTTEHIDAILQTQKQLPAWKKELFQQELTYRSN